MRCLWVALFALALVGCATPARQPTDGNHEGWVLEGRIAIRTQTEARSGSLRWEQQGERVRIQVAGPVGRGATELSGDSHRVRIRQAGTDAVIEGAPERVMEQQLGWSVPLQQVSSWLLGKPAAGLEAQHVQQDASGRTTAFEQAGFRLQVQWKEDAPARLQLDRSGLRVVIRVRRWLGLSESIIND